MSFNNWFYYTDYLIQFSWRASAPSPSQTFILKDGNRHIEGTQTLQKLYFWKTLPTHINMSRAVPQDFYRPYVLNWTGCIQIGTHSFWVIKYSVSSRQVLPTSEQCSGIRAADNSTQLPKLTFCTCFFFL